jgi:tight adherence protein B
MTPSRVRRLRRSLSALVVGAAALSTLGLAPAQAADSVGISAIEVRNGALAGLLSSTNGSAGIGTSLTLTVAGKHYPVDAITSGTGTPVKRSTVIVVDTSGSMGEAGMATMRSSVSAFLRSVPSDVKVGLVSFSGKAQQRLAPTADHDRVQRAVDALTSSGETALFDGITLGVKALGTTGERSILLLSDGADTASTTTRDNAAGALTTSRVRLEAVAFKTRESDTSVLAGLAKAGGGRVLSAANSGAVQSAFTSAAKRLASQLTFSLPLPPGVKGIQTITVAGEINGRPFTTKATVDFADGVAPVATARPAAKEPITGPIDETVPAATPAAAVPVLGVPVWLVVALAGVFVGLMVIGLTVGGASFKSRRQRRVENIERYVNASSSVQVDVQQRASSLAESLVGMGERMMQGRESTNKTMGLIEKADLPLRAGEWWVVRLVAMGLGLAGGVLLLHGGLVATAVGAGLGLVAGLVLPAAVLRFLANRRGKKFDSQLPDVLTLVASSLSTGFSLLQALDAVAKDAAEPAAKEFSRALAETRIGADVSDTLERMSVRMDSDNMRWTAMAIRIQREVGGNLAETLKTTANTLREREALRRHVRALSAEGRLSAYILIALPIGIFLFTMKTNREYIELLWTRPLGLAMIAAGLISLGVGVLWMRKVVDVQV